MVKPAVTLNSFQGLTFFCEVGLKTLKRIGLYPLAPRKRFGHIPMTDSITRADIVGGIFVSQFNRISYAGAHA